MKQAITVKKFVIYNKMTLNRHTHKNEFIHSTTTVHQKICLEKKKMQNQFRPNTNVI